MIAGLVLAAGESSRMGKDKALLVYRGRTFLESVVRTLRQAGIRRVAVVLGHHADEIQRALTLGDTTVVVNPDYARGQTSSLQAGLRAFADSNPEAIILCLVDHPGVSPDTLRKLVASFRQSRPPVVIPTFRNQRGHPVVIARQLFEELLSLSPEKGANSVMRKYRKATQFVEVQDKGVLLDVDDTAAYRSLEKDGEIP